MMTMGLAWCQPVKVQVNALAGTEVLNGESPRLVVTGLKANETATLHAYRPTRVYPPGDSTGVRVLAHAYAEFRASEEGRVDVDTAVPVRGTYEGADALGLLWSGEKSEWTDLGLKSGRSVLIRLEREGKMVADVMLQLTDGRDRVEIQEVAEPGLNGVFARPRNASQALPAIILLHGSNGGSVEGARSDAIRFAQLGYAAFAINSFSWSGAGGLPKSLVNIPVENLSTARKWLAGQPNVTTDRLAVWGVSKGAEYALVAAANLPWIDRVVGCVPSSVVWSGFGRSPLPDEVYSSWSVAGRSLPYIAYDNYADVLEGKLSAGAVHRRSLGSAPKADRAAARIPLEKTNAKVLLLGATRDHVWPSGEMTLELETNLRAANKGSQLKAIVFEGASHFICGTGEELQRISPVKNPEGNHPSPAGTARAAGRAWAETKLFLAR